MAEKTRDHGGDLDRARRIYGDGRWLDLSTGINPCPYPVPELDPQCWAALPTRSDIAALETAAAKHRGTNASVLALAGAQAAIQLVPRLATPGRACIVGPTYNEHAAALESQGWRVETIHHPEEGVGADLLTLVNPNNPDGRYTRPETLAALQNKVGLLVVDESFADCQPDISIAPKLIAHDTRTIVLLSFGKFFGLAGLRLGFAITSEKLATDMRALAGPWAVNGPALAIGRAALEDTAWQDATRARLKQDAARLDALAQAAGWRVVGGTDLFRTYETPDAAHAQDHLAQGKVWSRIFPYSSTWLRLGLAGSDADWSQLENALAGI